MEPVVPFYGESTIHSPRVAKFYVLIGLSTKMTCSDSLSVKRQIGPDFHITQKELLKITQYILGCQ